MHLYREHLVRIQKLEQQWKTAETRRQLAHQLFWKLFHHLPKCLTLKRSIRNQALVVGAVAQHPSFADRSIARQRRGEQASQTPSAPEPILIDRLETQRIQRCLAHGVSPKSHDRELVLDRCQLTPPRLLTPPTVMDLSITQGSR